MKKDIELLEGDMIIDGNIYYVNSILNVTYIWDSKNKKCVELEEYLKRIQPIKRKLKIERLKGKLK
jgi:hypothetical protein